MSKSDSLGRATRMEPDWDGAWTRVKSKFNMIADSVQLLNNQAVPCFERAETEFFPLKGYLSFSREGILINEDVVIAVVCKLNDGRYKLECDVSTGEGEILIDGPFSEIDSSLSNQAVLDRIENWIIRVETFLQINRDNIAALV